MLSRGTFVKEDKDKDGKLVRVGEWVRVDELKPVCAQMQIGRLS